MAPVLGQKLIGGEVKDAIHMAIIPVIAMEDLCAADRVGLSEDYIGEEYGVTKTSYKKLGIIDPYITEPIKKGDSVYLCLYPNTVEDMTHNWYHPDFGKEIQPTKQSVRARLERLLQESHCHISTNKLIEQLKDDPYGIWVGDDDSSNCMNYNKDEILNLISYLTSQGFDSDNVYFRCAC